MSAAWKQGVGILVAVFAVWASSGLTRLPGLSLRPHLRPPEVHEIRSEPPNSVNPLRADNSTAIWLDGLMFDSLVRVKNGKLKPNLASHWQSIRQGQTWDIQLNPRAKWWNGRPVSSDDVVWSYRLKLKQFGLLNRSLQGLRPQFATKGKLALIVTLNKPDPQFLRQYATSGPVAWILPEFLLSRMRPHSLLTTPYLTDPVDMVGSGSYRLLSLNSHSARLEANLHYFLGIPKPRRILVQFLGKHPSGVDG